MLIHICENCTLIDQVIQQQVARYDALSEENLCLHLALIQARKLLHNLALEVKELRDGLLAERQHNLQLHLLKHQTSVKKNVTEVNGATSKIKQPTLHAEILIEKQKKQYEEDLSIHQTLSDKCIAILRTQLEHTFNHNSVIFDMYEIIRQDLFEEKRSSLVLKERLNDIIKNLEHATDKEMINIKEILTAEVVENAHLHMKKSLHALQKQLRERDKLVSVLQTQQSELQDYMHKQHSHHAKEVVKFKESIRNLHSEILAYKEKFNYLNKRRLLDAEGFRSDVGVIRVDFKKLKREIASSGYEHKRPEDLLNLQRRLNNLDRQLKQQFQKVQ